MRGESYTCSLITYQRVEDAYVIIHKVLWEKEYFDIIHASLIPSVSSLVPKEKWMHFSKTSHLITSAYNRVCIDLTRYDFSKTFFPLQNSSPLKIMPDTLGALGIFQDHYILFKFI